MKKIFLTALVLLAPLSSQALFEIRAGYGQNTLDEDTYSPVGASMNLDNGMGFNVDFIFQPPLITDLGIGLRYEMMKYDIDVTSPLAVGGEAELTRLALLLNYRFIDTLAYFGLIGTADLKSDSDVEFLGTTSSNDTKFIWTAGVEGGVHLGLISIGGEVGKLFGGIEGDPGNPDLELDGLYGKVIVGFGF